MNAPQHYVVLDACALMPTILRRLLLRVAAIGVYTPVWSARIGEEWRRNAARLWKIPLADLEAEWAAMNADWPGADPGDLIPYKVGLKYSDPKDWHVIAAGLARRARGAHQRSARVSVMTWNLKDFNKSELRRADLAVATPDALLSAWFEADAALLTPALLLVMDDAMMVGRPGVDVAAVLRCERLYRLAKLWNRAQSPDAYTDEAPAYEGC